MWKGFARAEQESQRRYYRHQGIAPSISPTGCRGPLTSTVSKYWNGRRQHLRSNIGQYYLCSMRKQVSRQRLIALSARSIALLSGALGLSYAEVKDGPLQVDS